MRSLRRLGTDYVDLLLLHKPRCIPSWCEPAGTWQDAWAVLEDLVDQGLVRHIGMCDVTPPLLQEMLAMRVPPTVVQNRMDPFAQDRAVRRLCAQHRVHYQAYSTFGYQWHRQSPVFRHPGLAQVAQDANATVGQVVLRWALDLGVAVVPASTQPERIRENAAVATLPPLSAAAHEEIAALDGHPPDLQPEATLAIRNAGDRAATILWGRERIAEVAPEATVTLRTTPGHAFEAVDGEGRPLGAFTARRGDNAWVLSRTEI